MVLRCKINYILGIGIRVHKGNRSKIKGCDILKCRTGIEVLSGEPLIIFNTIKKSIENAIVTIAKNNLRCDSLIKYNRIIQSKDYGILCAGENNHTRIEKNQEICSNRLGGIKAIEGASIVVLNNNIFGNFG